MKIILITLLFILSSCSTIHKKIIKQDKTDKLIVNKKLNTLKNIRNDFVKNSQYTKLVKGLTPNQAKYFIKEVRNYINYCKDKIWQDDLSSKDYNYYYSRYHNAVKTDKALILLYGDIYENFLKESTEEIITGSSITTAK